MERLKIQNNVLFDTPYEVDGADISTIVKNDKSGTKLSGLIIKGYETKFGREKNTNGETFEAGCLDKFIQEYFIDNKLNMPVDVQHDCRNYCGRVLSIEVNTVGFYFIVYIPRKYKDYEYLRDFGLKEGIIQGFSRYGWATDYEYVYNPDGTWSHIHIKEMMIYRVSLVDTPANAVAFEKIQEIQNGLNFENKAVVDNAQKQFDEMFN